MAKKEEVLLKFKDWMEEEVNLSELFGECDEFIRGWFIINIECSNAADNNTLRQFLHVYDGDLEQAKNLLIINLKLRRGHVNIFTNRNIHSYEIQNAIRVTWEKNRLAIKVQP